MFCSLFKEKEAESSFETGTAITFKEVITACKELEDSIEFSGLCFGDVGITIIRVNL